jgi:hypothetical protein
VLIEWPDRSEIVDFVVPTPEEARALIAEGATNGRDLLEQAGFTPEDAAAELEGLQSEG